MPQDTRNHSSWIYLCIGLSLIVVFAIDLPTPMRVAIWVFYVLPVVLCMWLDKPVTPIITAIASSILMVADYALSTADATGTREVLQLNCAMGIFVLLVLAAVAHLCISNRGWRFNGRRGSSRASCR